MKKQFKKNEERLRNLWDNFQCSNVQIIGVPEGEEEEQETENSFEQIRKENFPNLAKEIDFQTEEPWMYVLAFHDFEYFFPAPSYL